MAEAAKVRERAPLPNLDARPLMDINTTPLIDVMLVLLIMFLITIPLQTHAVKVDLPIGPPPTERVDPTRNRIVVTRERTILWNGEPVSESRLRQYLAVAVAMEPQPELHLQPHPDAPYETVDKVLAITKRANVSRMGFVGNEAYADF